MDKEKQFTKREKKLLITAGTGVAICVIISALLNIIGGKDYHIQALNLTVGQAGAVWIVSFFPLYPKEPRFPWRWRTAVATAVGLASILIGYLLCFLALNAENSMLVATTPLVGSTPTFLFRIIEVRQTAREKERQDAM